MYSYMLQTTITTLYLNYKFSGMKGHPHYTCRCGVETWYLPQGGDAWVPGQCLLTVKPDWIEELVDTNDGAFWAPSLLDDRNMVYSVPGGDGGGVSCLAWARYTRLQAWQQDKGVANLSPSLFR